MEHLTEEERIEAFKKWWSQNWTAVVFPLLVALLSYAGWNFWQAQKQNRAQAGAEAYLSLMEKVTSASEKGAIADEQSRAVIRNEAQVLAQEYQGSLYGDYAKLILAKLSVEKGELDQAVSLLSAVVEGGENASIVSVARLRLARVLLAQERYDEALSKLSGEVGEAYTSLYAEARGDAYAAQGKRAEAHAAYEQSMEGLDFTQFARRSTLRLKRDNNTPPQSVDEETVGVDESAATPPPEELGQAQSVAASVGSEPQNEGELAAEEIQ